MRFLSILLLMAMLLTFAVGCGTPTTTSSTPDSDSEAPISSSTPTDNPDEPTPELPEGEKVVTDNYTAVLNDAKWDAEGIDTSKYALFGTGDAIRNTALVTYKDYKRTFVVIENGEEKTVSSIKEFKAIGLSGAEVTLDETAKTAKIKLVPVTPTVQAEWSAVSAKAGYYLMFKFTTNLPADYCITVTNKEGGSFSGAADVQEGIEVSGKNGKFTGIAKCNVPHSVGKTMYINICANGGSYPVFASIPVTITAPKYDLPYRFVFQGDWDKITDKSYIDNLYEVLYNSYPRAYQRWAFSGDEPKTLYVVADENSEAIAYNAGTKVVVQVAYANSSPADVGLFAHEFTHAIQAGYGIEYGNGWFTEAMADYGRFRFFHWGFSVDYIKDYKMTDSAIRDFRQDKNNPTSQWYGYAQHNVFMAYLDWKWPTTDKNGDGKITPDEHGLIDHIVYSAKMWTKDGKSPVSDYPYTEGSTFNNWVKDITAATDPTLTTMDKVRLYFIKELDAGTFVFKGFRDYKDNFLIQNVYDIPDLICPMKEKTVPTAKTNPILEAAIMTGDNLCKGAKIYKLTTEGVEKYASKNLIDGSLETRYQAGINKGLHELCGLQNEIIIDLGAEKAFDTYTLVGAGISMNKNFNMKEWEILVSNDGTTFTAVDYQKDNSADTVSVTFDTQTARYIKIRLYGSDQTGGGTARLFEFMVFKTK